MLSFIFLIKTFDFFSLFSTSVHVLIIFCCLFLSIHISSFLLIFPIDQSPKELPLFFLFPFYLQYARDNRF